MLNQDPHYECLGWSASRKRSQWLPGYDGFMEYLVGSRVRVKLYSGKVIEAKVVAIVDQSSGRKLQISFGGVTILIRPEQILEVLG